MIKSLFLGFIVLLASTSHSMFSSYTQYPNPYGQGWGYGGGYQQPYEYQGYGQRGYDGYFAPGYGYSQRRRGRPMRNPVGAPASPTACLARNCGTMNGLKRCLAAPESPYRSFVVHPERLGDVNALAALKQFALTHPNCFSQFCNRVCATVPEQFRQVRAAPIIEERNWFSRQKSWLLQDEEWRAREHRTRLDNERKMTELCNGRGLESREAQFLCSQCKSFIKGDRKIIKACAADLVYTGPVARPAPMGGARSQGKQGVGSEWDFSAFGGSGGMRASTGRGQGQGRLVMGRAEPTREMQAEIQREGRGRQLRQKKREADTNERDSILSDSDTSSQGSGSSQESRGSSSSQSSSKSGSSRASQSSQLTAENLAMGPQSQQSRPSIDQWYQGVDQHGSEEDGFSETSSQWSEGE